MIKWYNYLIDYKAFNANKYIGKSRAIIMYKLIISVMSLGFLTTVIISNVSNANELHVAARLGDIEQVKLLINNKRIDVNELAPEPNKENKYPKGTPLHWAVVGGYADIVSYLIQKGANINAFTDNGETQIVHTPLDYAVFGRHKNIVLILLKANASVESARHVFHWPLETALRIGEIDIAKMLITYGASINRTGVDGYTALHFAIEQGQIASVEFILKHNIDVNSCDHAGCCITPLHVAVREGNEEIIRCLLASDARIDIKNCQGQTPLSIASNEIAKILQGQ